MGTLGAHLSWIYKNYDKLTQLYTLDIPNGEIRVGLMQSLLPNYLASDSDTGLSTIGEMYGAYAQGILHELKC